MSEIIVSETSSIHVDISMREQELEKTILKLNKRIDDLETHLKKYTNGSNHKRYYEKNKDKIKESGSLYLQKLKEENPEKIKEYSKKAYIKKKLKKIENDTNTVEDNTGDEILNNSSK